jgi:hypothetical protein
MHTQGFETPHWFAAETERTRIESPVRYEVIRLHTLSTSGYEIGYQHVKLFGPMNLIQFAATLTTKVLEVSLSLVRSVSKHFLAV